MQQAIGIISGEERILALPNESAEVLRGVRWGSYCEFFTPAYWKVQHWLAPQTTLRYKLATSLEEEVTMCLLGGHGIPAEMAVAAFYELRGEGLLRSGQCPNKQTLEAVLRRSINVGGKLQHYRFPTKRADYLSTVLSALEAANAHSMKAIELRTWLMTFRGIGYKTASWIVRNWLPGSPLAVLDVHVIRAGLRVGLFEMKNRVSRDYLSMERRFVDFAEALSVDTAELDVLIWQQMRFATGRGVIPIFSERRAA